MSVQYLSNKDGQITAVQIPINEWEVIKDKYFNIESDALLPEWKKELIDNRLESIKNNPKRVQS